MAIPTFDIETAGWSTPISVGFFDGQGYFEFIKQNEQDDVVWRFLEFVRKYEGIHIFGHCSSKLDNKFILASLCEHDEPVSLEIGLAKLKWVTPNIFFEDSYLLAPMSLDRLAKAMDVESKKTWDHSKNLTPAEMGTELDTFRNYQKQDCLSLSQSLRSLCEEVASLFGVAPSVSLATTSAKAFSYCFYDLKDVVDNEPVEKFVRQAIYGGRNEVYSRYGENINAYDIKWMYVSCYDTPVPIGRLQWIKPNIDRGSLAHAKVKVPKDWYLGPLPVHKKRTLCFPVGEFEGWWDITELRYAAELGADIDIKRQLCTDEEPILKEFAEFLDKIRNRNTYLTNFWKLFGLSLSGKLGQSRWKTVIRHHSDIDNLEGYFPLDANETYFQTTAYRSGKNPYIKPAISMRVRAMSRVRHLRWLMKALNKGGKIFYSDTDSIFTDTTLETGDVIGSLRKTDFATRGYFIRPKLYAFISEGSLIQRSSGFSDWKLKEEDFIRLLNGEVVEADTQVLSSVTSIFKEEEVKLLERTRALRVTPLNNRVSEGVDTRPIVLPEY